jgi:uncharacterized protein DUF955
MIEEAHDMLSLFAGGSMPRRRGLVVATFILNPHAKKAPHEVRNHQRAAAHSINLVGTREQRRRGFEPTPLVKCRPIASRSPEMTEQDEDVALEATASNLLKEDVGMAVSVLQNFRANAQRTLDELRAKNADPALIEAARKAFAEAGESLQSAEHEAHAFAASFLMPEDDVLSIIPFVASLNQLVKAKKRWGVSVSALAYRLHKMGLLTDWQYRMFCIQINRKYEQSEPNRLPPERSRVWQMVLRELTG